MLHNSCYKIQQMTLSDAQKVSRESLHLKESLRDLRHYKDLRNFNCICYLILTQQIFCVYLVGFLASSFSHMDSSGWSFHLELKLLLEIC